MKLTPKASCNSIQGWDCDGDGKDILKASVTAIPEKGKANKALIALLSKHFKVAKNRIILIRGETSRVKTFQIDDL